jgi:energy-coupling factor transporter ATP-binding protein EcfA2
MAEANSFSPLEQAYINCDQIRPIEPNGADAKFHIEINAKSVQRLLLDLKLQARQNLKILFSGHKGCGKSTQLNYLAAIPEIKNNFLVVKYSIQDLLNPDDLDHIDLLVSMALKAYEAAQEAGIPASQQLQKKVQELADQLHGLIEKTTATDTGRQGEVGVKGSVGVPSILDFIKLQFFARYQLEFSTRDEVRKHYRPRLNELVDGLNAILDEIRLSLAERKNILILIDDTDKAPLNKSLHVFEQNGLHLAKPQCCVVYVIDMALVCSGRFRAIANAIGKETILPNLRLTNVAGEVDEEAETNRALFTQIANSRMDSNLIDDEALHEVITMSGGVMREFMALMAKSISTTLIAGRGRVTRADVDRAVIDTRNGFSLRADHIKMLQDVLRDPHWYPDSRVEDAQSPFLELLHTLALLEYRNGEEKWRQPHPILKQLLERPRVEQP